MNWCFDIIATATSQPAAAAAERYFTLRDLIFGGLLVIFTVGLTILSQILLLRAQHKWNTRFAEEQRDVEQAEKTRKDHEMRERIRQSFLQPDIHLDFAKSNEVMVVFVTLKNETPWDVIIRSVEIYGPIKTFKMGAHLGSGTFSKSDWALTPEGYIKMPPGTDGEWSCEFDTLFEKAELENCAVKCQYTTIYGDTAFLEIKFDPPMGRIITTMARI